MSTKYDIELERVEFHVSEKLYAGYVDNDALNKDIKGKLIEKRKKKKEFVYDIEELEKKYE